MVRASSSGIQVSECYCANTRSGDETRPHGLHGAVENANMAVGTTRQVLTTLTLIEISQQFFPSVARKSVPANIGTLKW